MFLVQCKEFIINRLTPLLVVTMSSFCWSCGEHIIVRTSSDAFIFNLGLRFEGCFERGIFWRAKSHSKGTEDFNLEHCSAPSLSLLSQNLFEGNIGSARGGPMMCITWGMGFEVEIRFERVDFFVDILESLLISSPPRSCDPRRWLWPHQLGTLIPRLFLCWAQ